MSSKSAMVYVEGLLAFPAVFEPDEYEGKKRFSVQVLMRENGNSAGVVRAAMKSLAEAGGLNLDKLMAGDKTCVKEGSDYEYDTHQGRLVIRAHNEKRPHVVDRDLSPLTPEDGKIYAGAVVRAKIQLWVQDNKYGQRINGSLMAVQFIEHEEPVAGQAPTLDGMEPLADPENPPF